MCLVAKKICKSNLIKGLKRKLEKKIPKNFSYPNVRMPRKNHKSNLVNQPREREKFSRFMNQENIVCFVNF